MGRLIVETLPQQGRALEQRTVFDKDRIAIGRSYENDIILDDPFVSPRHVSVFQQDGKMWLRDLASDNGTQVGGADLIRDKTIPIRSGDEIRIGRTRFRLFLPDHPVETTRQMDWAMAARDFIDRPWVPLLTSTLVLVFAIWSAYMEKPGDQFWNKEFYALVIGSIAGILSYPGLLSLYTFFRYKRSYFVRNMVVSNIGILAYMVYEELDPFLFFWVLNEGMVSLIDFVFTFALLMTVFWASVRLAHHALDWKETARLAWIPLILVLMPVLASDNLFQEFVPDPQYHTRLAPGMMPLTEPLSLDAFLQEGGQEFLRLEE